MPTQNVNLSEQQSEFIQRCVKGGDFRNASEVVRAGLRLLALQSAQDKIKLKHVRSLVKEGFDSLDRGEFETVDQASIPTFLDSVQATRHRKKTA